MLDRDSGGLTAAWSGPDALDLVFKTSVAAEALQWCKQAKASEVLARYREEELEVATGVPDPGPDP